MRITHAAKKILFSGNYIFSSIFMTVDQCCPVSVFGLSSENGSDMYLRNVGTHIQVH
jgi:hypothetical protein